MVRSDSVGLFWEDSKGSGILPPYPTDWKPAKEFPNLSGVKVLGLDTETYDPDLLTRGPGWGIGIGHIIGVSLATEDGHSWYFPMRHTVQKDINLDPDNVLKFVKDALSTDCPKIGANLMYDVGWLNHEGVTVNGPLYDIQFAEALIDDVAKSYSLETIANKYLGEGKTSNDLYEWLRKAYGGKATGAQRANMYRSPPSLAGPYAESDADLPIQILRKQWILLNKFGLVDLFKMECDLIPVLINMRMRGMNIDTYKAEKAKIHVSKKIVEIHRKLKDLAGFDMSVNSGRDIARLFDIHKQEYPITKAGNPSFVKDWLKANEFEGAQLIYDARRYEKTINTFIDGSILDKHMDNVIRPSLHPLRGEDGGAVSGRFSSSKPNGQQYPSRDDELAPLIRGIFIPDPGCSWLKIDYSQIEYRFFAHFSNAKWLIEAYNDPDTDFHDIIRGMLSFTGHRTPVKSVNFGLLYGMGKDKLLRTLSAMGLEMDPEAFLNLYHDKFPEARQMLRSCSNTAQNTGEIRTILNRRNTFSMFEPMFEWKKPLPYRQAIREYGIQIKRSSTHKALNRKLQGSAADLMKKAMVDIHKAGLFDKVGYPHITVHDELDFSYHPDHEKEFAEIKYLMENAIPLKVPVSAGFEFGPDWGHVK